MRHIVLVFMLCTALAAGAKSRFAYAYHRGTHDGVTVMHGDLEDALRVKKQLGNGRYLWARLDGREYVIRDDRVLDELDAALEPQRALHHELQKLHSRMRPYERRIDRIEDQIDSITDRDDGLTAAEEARVRELERELRAAERELRVYEQRERELERRETAIDQRVDAAIAQIVRKAVRSGAARGLRIED